MSIETAIDPSGARVLALAGELDTSNFHAADEAVAAIVADRAKRLVVDVSALRFLDSAGIATLAKAAAEIDEVRLRNPSPYVRRAIELTGLHRQLTIEWTTGRRLQR